MPIVQLALNYAASRMIAHGRLRKTNITIARRYEAFAREVLIPPGFEGHLVKRVDFVREVIQCQAVRPMRRWRWRMPGSSAHWAMVTLTSSGPLPSLSQDE